MFLEGNKSLIVLVSTALIVLVIGGIFVFVVRPEADLTAEASDTSIVLSHDGGEKLLWRELRISVTKGKNSSPVFVDPVSSEPPYLSPENKPLASQDQDNKFVRGDSVVIANESENGSTLEDGTYYRVVVKHSPTNSKLADQDIRIKEKYV